MRQIVLLAGLFSLLFSTEPSVEFKSIGAYKEFLSDMEEAAKKGSAVAAFNLGNAYLSNIAIGGKTVEADPVLAEKYLSLSAGLGHAPAHLALATLYLKEGQPEQAVTSMGNAVTSGSRETTVMGAQMMGAFVLDAMPDNPEALRLGKTALSHVAKQTQDPTTQFLLANIYWKLNEEQLANLYLNLACANPAATPKVKQGCYQNYEVEVLNGTGTSVGACRFR